MDVFGPNWADYMDKIEKNWRNVVQSDDLVLIAGDISWAMHLDDALVDLEWIAALPGTKVMIRGNHDYWWSSLSKVRRILPPTLHIIQNDSFTWNGYSIGGTRLWDSPEFNFGMEVEVDEKIFERELQRLELSLKSMSEEKRIVMTHYPPIGADLKPSRVSALLEHYHVQCCIFGHLHAVENMPFGELSGVHYILTAADYLDFKPLKIA